MEAAVQKLIEYALQKKLITAYDVYVVRNQLIEALHLTEWKDCTVSYDGEPIDAILEPLVQYACEAGIIADTANSRDLFDTKLMGIVTPMPREVVAAFQKNYADSPKQATDAYYALSKDLNYVRAGRIAKNLKWTYASEYGTLDLTINRSKPEKDPRDIAAAGKQRASSYPSCQLCPENAGFAGNAHHPARQNLRPIPMKVGGENWQMQYSPYGYYHEHCIVFNEKHTPMKIDAAVFEKLFDVLEVLPHYFIGSNADLPIVGGSILSHEHFQGGHYTFAMERAPIEKYFLLSQYPNVQAGLVKWPMSVIRLTSENRHTLAAACDHILRAWRSYSDASVGIFAETDGTPHNTITPIARMRGSAYECDLVLRNNLTTKDRPLGVFHPNPSLHHIKKENIGLIEVMGLAVLPARLAKEMALLKDTLCSGGSVRQVPELASHAAWAESILQRHPEFSAACADQILQDEIGAVFEQVLLDAGVFKRDAAGKEAFQRFIEQVE